MSMQNVFISGGQLYIDKKVFMKELLKSGSDLKGIVFINGAEAKEIKPPAITKIEEFVKVDYNYSTGIRIDENYQELFDRLKEKYQDKIRGNITLMISLLTTWYVNIEL